MFLLSSLDLPTVLFPKKFESRILVNKYFFYLSESVIFCLIMQAFAGISLASPGLMVSPPNSGVLTCFKFVSELLVGSKLFTKVKTRGVLLCHTNNESDQKMRTTSDHCRLRPTSDPATEFLPLSMLRYPLDKPIDTREMMTYLFSGQIVNQCIKPDPAFETLRYD